MTPGRLTAISATATVAALAIVVENSAVTGPAKILLGVLMMFALPGYALVSAAVPAGKISGAEWLLATLGTSVAIATCSAVLLGATIGLSQRSIADTLGCLTIAMSIGAWLRTSRVRAGGGRPS